MARQAARGVLALVLIGAVLESTGRGQPAAAPDTIYYRDRKDKDGRVQSKEGELKPAPAGGYQLVSGGKAVAVLSPADIVRVVPGELPGVDKKDINPLVTLETGKDWEKARAGYAELQKKTPNPQEKTRRFLEFKVATLSARAADETADDDTWDAKAREAVKLLDDYLVAHRGGWEVWPAAQACARLQIALVDRPKDDEKKDGDRPGERRMFLPAARTWAKLSQNKDVPADLRLEAGLQEADALVRARRYPEAAARAAELAKSAPPGPVKDRLALCELAAKGADAAPLDTAAKLEAEVAKAKDPTVRATGYGMLGEMYLAAGRPREAMWAFLSVEVVYNQDRDEVHKAMVRLIDAFQLQGDEDRAKAYRDKSRRYRASL